jgi:outer membrane protein OmpA-like peptidoglycan-associated protein
MNKASASFLAFVLAFGLSAAGCAGGKTSPSLSPVTESVKITMTPVVRQASVPKSVTQDASAGGIAPGEAPPQIGIPSGLRKEIETFTAYFETDDSTLQKDYRADALGLGGRLQPFAAQIRRIRVVGHCDTRGSEIHNQDLGEERAASLAEALSKSLNGVVIVTETLGSTNPDPPGQNPADWAKNRWARIQMEIQE